jgi:hypothetical protein
MLPKNKLAPWLNSVTLIGYEDEDKSAGGEGDPAEGAEGEAGENNDAEDAAKLKKALAAERLRSKNLEKKLRDAAASSSEDESEESEEEGEEPKKPAVKKSPAKGNSAAEKKLVALTAAFRNTAAKEVVRDLAKDFNDPADAYDSIDWTQISYEQDDDDPSIVVWDESEIRTAVKDLAKRKPYLLKQAGGGTPPKTPGRPSGSKFNGPQRPSTTDSKAQLTAFQQRFPAMRGVRGPQG